MKIKTDFVTNSSSTAFYFLFTGDKQKLLDLIKRHDDYFYLFGYDKIACRSEDIIQSLDAVVKSDVENEIDRIMSDIEYDEHDRCIIRPISHLIKIIENDIIDIEKDMIEYPDSTDFYENLKMVYRDHLSRVKNASETMKNYVEVEFGDNSGDVAGNKVGMCMDYSRPTIITADLMLFNESRH